jgi:hypothetical protein
MLPLRASATQIRARDVVERLEERTLEALWRRIGSLLDDFSPAECANYFRDSGYGST